MNNTGKFKSRNKIDKKLAEDRKFLKQKLGHDTVIPNEVVVTFVYSKNKTQHRIYDCKIHALEEIYGDAKHDRLDDVVEIYIALRFFCENSINGEKPEPRKRALTQGIIVWQTNDPMLLKIVDLYKL